MPPTEPSDSYLHIRRLNPNRDLDAVADLVEDAFELKGDPEGAWVLHQMRAYARRAKSYPDIFSPPGAPEGFVWEANGKIVGNISIVKYFQGDARKVLIANVAVARDFRRRGIASALTRHALRFIGQQAQTEVWLQVRSENQAAIQMYGQLGFEFSSALSQWRCSPINLPHCQPRRVPAGTADSQPKTQRLETAEALAGDELSCPNPLVFQRQFGVVFSMELSEPGRLADPYQPASLRAAR